MQTSNAVATAKPIDRFKQELALREGMLKDLLPKGMPVTKFQAIVVSAVADNMDLLDCDRGSLLKACLQAAELGLSLNKSMGEADILKVWNGRAKRNDAQFRPRYKGLMKLALQSGEVLKIESRIVYANDLFEVEEGIEPRITHKHGLGNRGDMVGAYCVWKLRNGETQFEIMSKEEIEAIRNRSSSKTKDGRIVGPWDTDPAEMWRKTVVRRATKYMPLSTEASRAVHIDNVAEGIEDIENNTIDHDAIDITAVFGEASEPEPEPEPVKATNQLDRIAKKVAPQEEAVELEMLNVTQDDDGDDDWDNWVRRAMQVTDGMTDKQKREWAHMHRHMLDEAELMNARNLGKLITTLKG